MNHFRGTRKGRMMKIYESAEILAMDDLYVLQEKDEIIYRMTNEEGGWLDFVKGRYCIADYFLDAYDPELNATRIQQHEMSRYLDDDNRGAGKAVMLSDHSALQKIIFWIYSESEVDEDEERGE